MNIVEIDKPKVKRTIVVYGGRFQPFHKGHYAAYKSLVNKFGAGNVFIGSSNVSSQPKSPFSFQEKKKIATTMFDIPSNRFVMIKNPYNPVEILSKFDEKTTQYVAAVGEKDAERLGGDYFKPYRGKAGYGYGEIGYVYLVPPQADAISGTDVRKHIGGKDEKKAVEFFKKVYPKYDKSIFDLIRNKLINEDINVGVDVGDTVLMGKFKNKKVKVKDISSDSHGMPTINGKQATTFRTVGANELYNPIDNIIDRFLAEQIFEEFITEYLGEAEKENPIMDKEIEYTNAAGEKKKIQVRAALRLAKDHPAHIEAEKLTGKDKETPTPEKEQPFGTLKDKEKEKPESPDVSDKLKTDTPEKEKQDPQALTGAELESDAEKSTFDKIKEKATELANQARKKCEEIINDFTEEEQHEVHETTNPHSETRKGWRERISDFVSNLPRNIAEKVYEVAKHKYHQFRHTGRGIQSLILSTMHGGKPQFGWHKDKDGTWTHSEEEAKKQKKACIGTVKDAAIIAASVVTGGAIAGAAHAAVAGQGIGAVAHAAVHGAAHSVSSLTGFAAHAAVDFAKHCGFEAIGLAAGASHGGAVAGATGAGLGHMALKGAGLAEGVDDVKAHGDMFIKLVADIVKRMETFEPNPHQLLKTLESYKKQKSVSKLQNFTKGLSEEHYVPTTGMFNRNLSPQQKIDKLNPARAIEKSKIWHKTFSHHNPETGEIDETSDSKTKSINHFVEYATKRLKLNQKPKINLVGGGEFAESQTSLGGYDDNTKEIFVSTEGRLTADILRTIAHEMVHRKQDEMGIIKDRTIDGKTGSEVENKAHAVAGILMREYGNINKKIFQEGVINEASSIQGAFNDDQPDGMFLPKGHKRRLGNNDGINKSDEWFTNGGYIQIDFPSADTIFGDDEQDQPYVIWRVKNLPRTDFKPTKFNKKNFVNEHRVVSLLKEGGAYGHMSHPFDDMGLTFGDLKRIISGALNGRLELAREKTDGQALAISWKNGRLIAARNKGHLANAGKSAMGIEDVASKFAGRGGLTDAYNFAMKDLNAAISGLSEKQKEKIFSNGKCFMNLEVIWPESVNVIPYGQALLVFHGTVCYDDDGKAVSADQSTARVLAGMIKQINANVQSKYTLAGPPVLELPKSKELSSKQGYWFGKLNKLQSKFGLSDSDSVSDYHYAWWADFIDKESPVKPDRLTKEALIRRWGFGEKSFRLNTISDKGLQDWAIEHDKVNVPKQQRDNIKPFEEIFLGVGSEVLQFVTSVITVHPDKAIRAMKAKLDSVAQKVKQTGDPSIIKKFKNELERLNSLGGVDKIVAAEGIVFVYNGKTYKLTGTFAPLNQLLGIFYE
jgi:hypothetical protein